MLSIPPASIICLSPNCNACAAIVIAFMPDEHTLFIVVASVDSGQPLFGFQNQISAGISGYSAKTDLLQAPLAGRVPDQGCWK